MFSYQVYKEVVIAGSIDKEVVEYTRLYNVNDYIYKITLTKEYELISGFAWIEGPCHV